jgi:hypothetical protein
MLIISKKTQFIWVWRRSALSVFRYSQNKKFSYKKFKYKFSFFLFLLGTSLLFLLFSWVRQCKEISLNYYMNCQAGTTILRQSRIYPPRSGTKNSATGKYPDVSCRSTRMCNLYLRLQGDLFDIDKEGGGGYELGEHCSVHRYGGKIEFLLFECTTTPPLCSS